MPVTIMKIYNYSFTLTKLDNSNRRNVSMGLLENVHNKVEDKVSRFFLKCSGINLDLDSSKAPVKKVIIPAVLPDTVVNNVDDILANRAEVRGITDPDTLAKIAINKSQKIPVRIDAIKKIKDPVVLMNIAIDKEDDVFVRKAAIWKIENRKDLESILANNDNDFILRTVKERLSDLSNSSCAANVKPLNL